MSPLSDQILARRTLDARDRGGHTLGSFLRTNAKRYLVLLTYFGLIIAGSAYLGYWPACTAAIGVVFGCLLRDIGWLRGVKRSWAFTVRIIDWKKVEEMADGKPASEE